MPLPPRLTGFGQVSFCVQAKARFLFVRMESSADVSTSYRTTLTSRKKRRIQSAIRARIASSNSSYGAADIAAR